MGQVSRERSSEDETSSKKQRNRSLSPDDSSSRVKLSRAVGSMYIGSDDDDEMDTGIDGRVDEEEKTRQPHKRVNGPKIDEPTNQKKHKANPGSHEASSNKNSVKKSSSSSSKTTHSEAGKRRGSGVMVGVGGAGRPPKIRSTATDLANELLVSIEGEEKLNPHILSWNNADDKTLVLGEGAFGAVSKIDGLLGRFFVVKNFYPVPKETPEITSALVEKTDKWLIPGVPEGLVQEATVGAYTNSLQFVTKVVVAEAKFDEGLGGVGEVKGRLFSPLMDLDAEKWIEGDRFKKPANRIRAFETLLPQILLGLAELHSKGFVHLDLRPDNVLVRLGPGRAKRPEGDKKRGKGTEDALPTVHAFVHDLGVARWTPHPLVRPIDPSVRDENKNITLEQYRSPETLLASSGATGMFPNLGEPDDVWALGVTMLKLLLSNVVKNAKTWQDEVDDWLFYDKDPTDAETLVKLQTMFWKGRAENDTAERTLAGTTEDELREVWKRQLPTWISEEHPDLVDVISVCLDPNRERRYTYEELLNTKYIVRLIKENGLDQPPYDRPKRTQGAAMALQMSKEAKEDSVWSQLTATTQSLTSLARLNTVNLWVLRMCAGCHFPLRVGLAAIALVHRYRLSAVKGYVKPVVAVDRLQTPTTLIIAALVLCAKALRYGQGSEFPVIAIVEWFLKKSTSTTTKPATIFHEVAAFEVQLFNLFWNVVLEPTCLAYLPRVANEASQEERVNMVLGVLAWRITNGTGHPSAILDHGVGHARDMKSIESTTLLGWLKKDNARFAEDWVISL